MMKKIAIATVAIFMLSACGTSIGPGNKEDVDDNIEQQNYRGNDMNQPNNQDGDMNNNRFNDQNLNDRNNNNLNRRQMNDDLGPDVNDNNTDENLVR